MKFCGVKEAQALLPHFFIGGQKRQPGLALY